MAAASRICIVGCAIAIAACDYPPLPALTGSNAAGQKDDPDGIGCHGAIDCARFVFVSSVAYTAHLNEETLAGPPGADQKCQRLADQAMAPISGRVFRAWLGSQLTPATARHPHGSKPYRLVDGTTVADNWADLTDGSLGAGINLTEIGTTYSGSVWTATDPSGEPTGTNCDDWQTTGGTGGAIGVAGRTDKDWTDGGCCYGCATQLPLYCVEY